LINEMAAALKQCIADAPKGKEVVSIHLFGIRHAKTLEGIDLKRLAALAGESEAYGIELDKGRRLAEYVTVVGEPT